MPSAPRNNTMIQQQRAHQTPRCVFWRHLMRASTAAHHFPSWKCTKIKRRIFVGQKGPWTCAQLCILQSLSGPCLDALTANVTACVRLKSQSSRRQHHMRKLNCDAPRRRVIFRSQRAQIIVMLQCPEPNVAFWFRIWKRKKKERKKERKKKKHKAPQMSKEHRVLSNLYSALSAHSRTCSNIKHSSFCRSAFQAPWPAACYWHCR